MTGPEPAAALAALAGAAREGARYGAFDPRYHPLAEAALATVGPVTASHLLPGETLGVFAPVQVLARSRLSPGAVTLTDRRVIVAWNEGLTVPQAFASTCPLSEVRGVERGVREMPLMPPVPVIAFWADSYRLELVFATAVAARLVTLVQQTLAGSARFRDPDVPAPGRQAFGILFDTLPHPRGAVVEAVVPGSEAALAGLEPRRILTHVAGRRVEDARHATAVLESVRDLPEVELQWWLDGVTGRGVCVYQAPPAAPATVSPAPVSPAPVSPEPPGPPSPVAPSPVASSPVPGRSDDPELAEVDRALALARTWPTGDLGARLTPTDVAAASAEVLDAFVRGDLEAAWRRRLELGAVVPSREVDRAALFWLDAAGALAALHLGLREHPVVASWCGLAVANADRDDPGQAVVVQEVTQLYHRPMGLGNERAPHR